MDTREKQCSRCRIVRPSDSYSTDNSRPDNKNRVCRVCMSAYQKQYYKNNKERAKLSSEKSRVLSRYGITHEQKNALFKSVKACEICYKTFHKTPNIDHDHVTGLVRGLLCRSCNIALGLFEDNTTNLLNAVKYLERKPNDYSK